MRGNLTILVALLVLLGVFVLPAYAQGPPPHDHFLVNPGTGEQIQVGPHRCALGETVQEAFLNFHNNVHVGAPRSQGGLVMRSVLCS